MEQALVIREHEMSGKALLLRDDLPLACALLLGDDGGSGTDILSLAQDKYGSYIVQRLLKSSLEPVRQLAVERLQACRQDLEGLLNGLGKLGGGGNPSSVPPEQLFSRKSCRSSVGLGYPGAGPAQQQFRSPGVMAY